MRQIFETEIIARSVVADATYACTLKRPRDFEFIAGQHSLVSLPQGIASDRAGNARYFSLAGAPHEATLTVVTRFRNTAFKRYLCTAPVGAPLQIEAAKGTLRATPDAVFIAGGVGIVPFVSIMRDKIERRDWSPCTLFYADHSLGSAIHMNELLAYAAAHEWFSFRPTLTGEVSEDWGGLRGRIDARMLGDRVGAHRRYGIAGAPAMVHDIRKLLGRLGVHADAITAEEFCGYSGFRCPHCAERFLRT